MTTPANLRGWGQGWPVNRSGDMVTVKAARSGTEFTVHRDIGPIIKYLVDEVERRGYLLHYPGQVHDDWSYNNRPIRGTRRPSNHSWGLAIDIDATQFPLGSSKRLPTWLVELFRAHGFDYGGDWSGRKDPMHFEFNGWPSDARRIATQIAGRPAPSLPTITPPPYNPQPGRSAARLMEDDMVIYAVIDGAGTRMLQWSGDRKLLFDTGVKAADVVPGVQAVRMTSAEYQNELVDVRQSGGRVITR